MLKIKPLTTKHLVDAVELEKQFTRMPFFLPVDKEYLMKVIKGGFAYGFFDDEKLIGKVGFIKVKGKDYEVDGLVISPDYRRKGLGKELMKYGLEKLRQNKFSLVFLFTHPENSPAIGLYLKLGFVIKEWMPNKYGPGAHRLRMVKLR